MHNRSCRSASKLFHFSLLAHTHKVVTVSDWSRDGSRGSTYFSARSRDTLCASRPAIFDGPLRTISLTLFDRASQCESGGQGAWKMGLGCSRPFCPCGMTLCTFHCLKGELAHATWIASKVEQAQRRDSLFSTNIYNICMPGYGWKQTYTRTRCAVSVDKSLLCLNYMTNVYR